MRRLRADPGEGMKTDRRAMVAVVAIGAVALGHLATFWPGIMVWDAIRQYGQALTGHYDDWHPPAMNWLWRRLLPLHDGPAPMLALQILLYWSGFGLLVVAALRRGQRGAAAALAALSLMPVSLVLIGTVLKDSLMAGLLLVAVGLCGIGRRCGWTVRIAVAVLLLAAATLRFNAVPACLPLVWLLLPAGWGPRLRSIALAVALVPLLLAMPLANRLLQVERSGVELSLVIYDLAGITRRSGIDMFPALSVADPVAVNARCYDPVSWDRYAWWGDDPCPIGFVPIRAALATRHEGAYRRWLGAVVAHPLAYAAHRLDHFNSNSRFLIHDAAVPGLSLRSDPNVWHFAVPPSRLRDAIGGVARWSLGTPLGWPCWWLALGFGLLVLVPALPQAGAAIPLLASGLLYGFSYLPLSVASEVRYHLWTMLAVGIAAIEVAVRMARGAPVARGRVALAAAPVVIVTLLAIGARLL